MGKNFTKDQLKAIETPGSTLVVAGAGAGKTGTLVERCARLLLREDNPVRISKILVVTFTEAAAAEVRDRIRRELEQATGAQPDNLFIQEQLAGLDSARISTLHSFCYSMVRESFHRLELDPAVSVIQSEEAAILFRQTFDELLREHMAGAHPFSAELKEVLSSHFRGWDKLLHEFIRQIHDFTQTRPNPEAWFETQIADLSSASPPRWPEWHRAAVEEWRRYWIPYLKSLPAENSNAHACAELLHQASAEQNVQLAAEILRRDGLECWPKRKKGAHRKPFEKLFEEAAFLASLAPNPADGKDPLREDWEWNARPMLALLRFARQFSDRFAQAKRQRAVLDFHDLEQFALRLLWDGSACKPTSAAAAWQRRLEAIFVDEYQDINAAQDLMISALTKPGPDGNRFLVGDVKQSIYSFRQANPSIFRQYLEEDPSGAAPARLSDNFRSHEGILNFVNPVFRCLMKENCGGVEYDAQAELRFGNGAERPAMSVAVGQLPPVELHLLYSDEAEAALEENSEDDGVSLESGEQEAGRVALRLRELRESGFMIYHQKEKKTRAVEWRDMVVLLRAAAGRVETYAKAFAAAGVPLHTKRAGFFETQEVLDLCNLLAVLDNPLQDIPLVATLRSPLFGLTAQELAQIRIHVPHGLYWQAMLQFLEQKWNSTARDKIERFFDCFHRWRNPRTCSSLAQRLEKILAETGYAEWVLRQPHGGQRHANIQQLVRMARQFDQARGESLYLFLRHLQQVREGAGDIEPATLADENSVRLMTVHQSKGLEFPVVAVAGLGARINHSDSNRSIMLHDRYGICSMIKPPDANQFYPSLPLWLARREARLKTVGEEMRVLYVALTRAENHLLLFGSTTEKRAASWGADPGQPAHPQQKLKLLSWLDWIGTFAATQASNWLDQDQGVQPLFSYRIHREAPLPSAPPESGPVESGAEVNLDALKARCSIPYPFPAAIVEPAKTSVTALRRRASDPEVVDFSRRIIQLKGSDGGRERGVATHAFLQLMDLHTPASESALRRHAQQLADAGLLKAEDLARVDFTGVAAFWNSEFGREILERKHEIVREAPFTFRLSTKELEQIGLERLLSIPAKEFVVIQGVADLVVHTAAELWLIDFKTDSISDQELSARARAYQPQMALYALALASIYKKPVARKGLYFLALRRFEWL